MFGYLVRFCEISQDKNLISHFVYIIYGNYASNNQSINIINYILYPNKIWKKQEGGDNFDNPVGTLDRVYNK